MENPNFYLEKQKPIPDKILKMLSDVIPPMGAIDSSLLVASHWCDSSVREERGSMEVSEKISEDESADEKVLEQEEKQKEKVISSLIDALKEDKDVKEVAEFLEIKPELLEDELQQFRTQLARVYTFKRFRDLGGWTVVDENKHETAKSLYMGVRIEFIRFLLVSPNEKNE